MPNTTMNLTELTNMRDSLVQIRNALGKFTRNDDPALEPVDDTATIGDVVEVAPVVDGEVDPEATPVTGEIVEIVVEDENGAVVENKAQYRRVANAKVIRNATGGLECYVPVATKTTTANATPKAPATSNTRYVRVANRKSCNENGGRTIADMQAGVPYKPAYPADQYATITKNIAQLNAMIENAIVKDTVKKEIDEALKETGIKTNAATPAGKHFVRTKNFRHVKNNDGTLEVIIDTAGAEDVSEQDLACFTPAPITDGNTAPIEETLAIPTPPVSVEVVVDGIPVATADTLNKAGTKQAATQTNNSGVANTTYNAYHPELQPLLAGNADLQAMLALAHWSEQGGDAQPAQTGVDTLNAAAMEYVGDEAPLEIPVLFPKK